MFSVPGKESGDDPLFYEVNDRADHIGENQGCNQGGENVEDIVKGGPHRSLVEEQVVKNHGRCKYQKGSNAGPDIFSVTIQFHKNVNPLSNFINLYYTHAIPKIQPQPHLREKKETAILEKQI